MPRLMSLVRRDPTHAVGDPIGVIPTTLLRLAYDQALELDAILADQGLPNSFVDQTLVTSSKEDSFWIDLAQFCRDAPDIAVLYKGRGCRIEPGCRVNTKRANWLRTLHYQLKNWDDHTYRPEGTSWVNLQYAVLVSKATRVYTTIAKSGNRCVRQRELPFASLHVVPPTSVW